MAAMQPATPLQLPNLASPSGPCLSQQTPVHQEKAAKPHPQTQNDSCPAEESGAAPPSQQVPRLRALVESQAFKNILVDEMDMMVSRAATVIQASWKGYRLRQKLVSQMTAAKAIQEAWRRFSTRRLVRSNRLTLKKAKREEEGDIPYHPPQQVRFHAPEDQPPVMVNKETQFPSEDNLVPSHTPAAPGPCISRVHRGGLLPQQPVTVRPTGPKYAPCMLTKTVRSSCLIRHLEGDSVKSRHVASKSIRLGTPESAAAGRYNVQAIHGSMKTQTHVHNEAGVPKAPPHMYPVNKTPTKVCPVAIAPKSPATVATAPKSVLQTCPTSPATVMKMRPVTCPTSQVTKPLAHVRPSPSFSGATPHMRSVVPMARAQPPGCAVTSTTKAPPRPRVPISKGPLQTGPGPMTAKTSPQVRPVTRNQPQTCAVAASSKTSTQAGSTVKSSPQTRLAAMITKTPAQIRSVAAVLRTLCLVPTVAASSPRGSPQTPVVASIPNAPSQVHLISQNAKVTMNTKQNTAAVKVASQSHLGEEKGECGPHGHLDVVSPKLPAKSPLEAEKMKPGPPRVPKKEAAPKTNATVVTRALSWTKVTEDTSKPLTQIQQKAEVVKVHSRVYMPEEMTVTLSKAQLAVPLTKASSQVQPPPSHPRALPSSPISKAVSQSHPIPGLATGLLEGRHPPLGPSATLSSPLAAHLMSLTAQLQPAGEQTRSMSRAHPATSCSATASPKTRSPGMTFVLPEGYPNTWPLTPTSQHHMASHSTKSSPQLRLPAEHVKTTNTKPTKATCQDCPPTKLSKAPSLAQLITCLARVPSQTQLPTGLAKTQPQAQLPTGLTKTQPQAQLPTGLAKTQPQAQLPTGLTKTQPQAQLPMGLTKTQPQAQLPMGLAKTQPQAQLASETAKGLLAAHPATDVSSKTQSQPLLGTAKAPVQFWQNFGTLNTGPRAKSDDRNMTQPQLHSHAQNKATQNPRPVATDIQGMLVPLLAPTGHPVCNAESWGDSGQAQASPPPPMPSQAVSCHEDLAASIASLCADLVAMLGSPEDLRTLLAKTLSQGEVRTALSQALSREVLGPSVVKALPQGMLGMALMKALSWGELGITLSRALSRGELRPELSKATQGKLAEVLCKTLTEDERTTLSQALCQGELGAVFTQSLAQMAQRTGAFLPKATSKMVGSRMTTAPAPVEVTCSGSLSVAWGPALGPVRARCSKVRLPWRGLPWGQPEGILWGEGDGATVEGSPCSPESPIVTSTYQRPLLMALALSWGRGSGLCSGLYLKPLDFDPMACGEGPQVPQRSSQRPTPCPWQPLVANGAGPSSHQPSVTGGTAPSSRQQPLASRVSHPWASYREGNTEASKHSSGMGGGGKCPVSQRATAGQGRVCQCPNLRTHKTSLCGHCSSVVKSRSPSPKQNIRQILPLGHRPVSPLASKEIVTIVRNMVDEQHSEQSPAVSLNPKLPKASSPPTPKQERHSQVSLTSSHPQGQATGHHMSLLDELLATFPQHPKIVLAKSYPRGSVVHSQIRDSHSSLHSGTSASASTPSSLTSSEVLEGCREGDLQAAQPVLTESREVRHRPQGQLERTEPAGSQHTVPQFRRSPLDLRPLFCSTSLALNVQWDSDSGSDYSTGDLTEGLSQDTAAPWQRSPQLHAGDLQRLDPTLPQHIPTDGRAPSPGQAPEASEVSLCLSQPLEATGLCPTSSLPAGSSTMSPSLTQPSMDTGVAPSLAHSSVATRVFPTSARPSMDTGVFPTSARPSMDTGVSPTLTEPLMHYGFPTNLSQPFLFYRGSPIYTQPHMASGVPSNFTQTSGANVVALGNQAVSSGVASSQPQLCTTTHMAPRATQSPVNSWPPPGSSSMPPHGAGHPDSTQTSVATGVSPNFFQPFIPYSMPSNFTQPCVATIVTPNLVQPPVSHSLSPSLAQPLVVSVMSPTLANRAPPNLGQPTTASGVVPGVLQVPLTRVSPSLRSPLLAPRVCSNLAQASVATLGTLSLLPPTVVCGMGRGTSKPALGPQQHAQEDSQRAQSQPCTLNLGGSCPCSMSRLGQPSLRLMTGTRTQPSPQDPTVYSELTQASKGPPGPVAQSMAPAEDSGLVLGANVPCQTWFRGIAPGMSQGPVATRLFLSMYQGDNPPPMAAWALPVDVPWTQEQAVVTTGVGQGPCPAVMPSVQVPSEFFPNQLGTGFPQTCASLPVTLDPQLLSMATMVPPSCRSAGVVIPDAAVGAVGEGLAQESVNGKVPSALVPKPVVEIENVNLFQGPVSMGVAQSVPPESMVDGVAQSVPPESTVDGVAQSVPPESMIGGVRAQNLPPESVVSGEVQGSHQDSVASDMALSLPPCSVAPCHPREVDGSGGKLSSAAESLPSSYSLDLRLGLLASGTVPSVPLGAVTSNVAPGSMLVGISPRPYQAAQPGEHSRLSFLAPHVTSLANAHSAAPAVQKVSQDQQHVPTVLSSTSQFNPDPGLTKLVGVDNPTLLKPRQIHDIVSSTLDPGIDPVKSEGLEIMPWTGLGATGGERPEHETLAAENILKDQVALLAEEAPSQARGITLVPTQAPSLGEHPTANSITPVQPLSSESNSGHPSLCPAPRTPSLQETPVADSSCQPPASNAVTGPPQLSPNTDGTAKLPPGLEVSTGDPSIPQSSGGTDSAPLTKNRTFSVSQVGKPQNHTKGNHQEPLTAKNSYRSNHNRGSLVSELLEGSMDRLLPFSRPLKTIPQVSPDSHKWSSGTPMVDVTPVIHLGDGRGQKAPSGAQEVSLPYESSPKGSQIPILGETHWPAKNNADPHHTPWPPLVTGPGVSDDGDSLVPTTTHDQNVQYVTSPETGYDRDSQSPTAPLSCKHQHVTVPKTSFDESPQRATMLYGHRLQYITVPKTSLDGSSPVPTTPHGHKPHLVAHPKTGHNKISPPPTVPQGPVDAGPAAGQSWNSKVPNVSIRATAHAGPPRGTWHPSRGHRPWDPSGAEAALDHKPSAELLVSVRAMEKVVVQAIITIQACARGYLVRRTVKVWHQWATIIQATWRGYRVRRNLARLLRATTIIQAAWRGYCIRRAQAHQVLLPTMWPEHSGRAQGNSDARSSSEHRCFLSCQPDICNLCQSLGPRAESPPSVVMLVGSQPRTCHVCGHTLSTRVVHGFGQGISGQSDSCWASVPWQHPLLSQQHRAATLIQAAWKGYRTRRQLSQQQSAAKTVQATWRGHYTRSCLTTDALLGTGSPWAISRDTSRPTSRAYSLHWPGV